MQLYRPHYLALLILTVFRIIDELVDCDRYFLNVKYFFDSIVVIVSHEDSPSYPSALEFTCVCHPLS